MHNYSSSGMERIVLPNDYGKEISFRGRIFSECSYYDEETKTITRQCLYITDKGEQAYSIATGAGSSKERRAYLLHIEGDECIINNGAGEIVLRTDLLMATMQTLCNFDQECSEELLKSLEETLNAANI